jgi:hypothetical protein
MTMLVNGLVIGQVVTEIWTASAKLPENTKVFLLLTVVYVSQICEIGDDTEPVWEGLWKNKGTPIADRAA